MSDDASRPDPFTRRPLIASSLAAAFGALALCVLPALPAPAGAADGEHAVLTLVVEGLASDAGSLAFGLYDSAASYAEMEGAVRKGRREIVDGGATWKLEKLPPGDYALTVYHDENDNGVLDRGAFGMPEEPFGFSNDARGRMGPPGWKKVRFAVVAPATELRVKVR